MKKFLAGLVMGVILATGVTSWAVDQQVKLIVDGKEVTFADAPPQMINGRTMVPARPLAEALGAKVSWDGATSSVVVTKATVASEEIWLTASELNETYGVSLASDGTTMTLTRNDITFTMPLRGATVEGALNGKAIRGEMRNARLYLNLGDLTAAGFVQ